MAERVKIAAKTPEAKKGIPSSKAQRTGFFQSTTSPIDRILFLQRTIGNQAVLRMLNNSADSEGQSAKSREQRAGNKVHGVQSKRLCTKRIAPCTVHAKLKIGQPNDVYEQEADRVEEQVMRMPIPEVQRQPEEELIVRDSQANMGEFTPAWYCYQKPEGEKKEKPREPEKGNGACKGTFLLLSGKAGEVYFYAVGKQNFLAADKTEVKDKKDIETGAFYIGAAEIDPEDCGELEFVQNVQTTRVVTFKDDSKLEKNTPWGLDTSDPYPTFPLKEIRKGKLKTAYTNDSPGQGTSGTDGFIDTLSVKDTFKLFLMVKTKKQRTTIGLANWNWEGKVVTTDKKNTKAPLKLESGKINAPDGSTSSEKPLLSPNIKDEKFKVVGKSQKTLASLFEEIFNGKKGK